MRLLCTLVSIKKVYRFVTLPFLLSISPPPSFFFLPLSTSFFLSSCLSSLKKFMDEISGEIFAIFNVFTNVINSKSLGTKYYFYFYLHYHIIREIYTLYLMWKILIPITINLIVLNNITIAWYKYCAIVLFIKRNVAQTSLMLQKLSTWSSIFL